MTDIATVPRSLEEIGHEINRAHQLCETTYSDALDHARRCGELLLEAKAQLGHGEWLPWLATNFAGGRSTAAGYMRLARANVQELAHLGIEGALKELAGPPAEEPAPAPARARPDERIDVGAALRNAGLDPDAMREELARRPKPESFPRSGMERRTWRDIGHQLQGCERSLRSASQTGLGDYGIAESLSAAARQAREAAGLLDELAQTLR